MISTRSRRSMSLLPNYIVLVLLTLFALAPVVVLLLNSVKPTVEIGVNPLGLPRGEWRWSNYAEAWQRGNFAVTIRNSVIVVIGTVVGVCLVSGLAAYALARLGLPGADTFIILMLIFTSLPAQLFLVPLFFL